MSDVADQVGDTDPLPPLVDRMSESGVTFGPKIFEQRRELWRLGLLHQPSVSNTTPTRRTATADTALTKLEEVLGLADVENNDALWREYLEPVYRKLVSGTRVKKGLRLSHAIRILYIGWVRDGSWTGDQAPMSSGPPIPGQSSPRSPPPRASMPVSAVRMLKQDAVAAKKKRATDIQIPLRD